MNVTRNPNDERDAPGPGWMRSAAIWLVNGERVVLWTPCLSGVIRMVTAARSPEVTQ